MNHIYHVVFNTKLGIWQAVSELGKSRKKTKSSSNRTLSLKPLALTIGLFAATGNQLLYAVDLPQGGQVTAGSASISTNANTMTVTQDTPKAAINWQSFDIGKENTVNFKQPDSSAVILNRVIGNEKSVIDGALNANGQVYLLNSNGVLFGKNASVNVGGLVASTNNISDKDFMEGKTTFESNGSKGKVINLGTITAKEGGYVALLGNNVTNEGVITAKLGAAVMAAGDKVSLNFNGNSMVGVTVDEGTLKALVENKHAIIAENGLVVMTAKGLDKVMAGVVNNSGEIQASSIVEKGGKIYLTGDEVTNSGKISADGAKGGGEVLVGGDWQGSNAEQHPQATQVTLTQTSEISANATKEGDGGKVVAWSGVDKSDSVTKVDGKISAEGKGKNTKGGKIETSGRKLDIAEKTDIKTNGGEWLLDPVDIAIDNTLATAVSGALGNSNVTITTAGNNTPSTTSGESGTTGDITVNAPVSWTSDKDLTLHADGNINIKSDISATHNAAKLTLEYGQGAVAASNTADYNISRNVKVNLADGQNFSTKLGSDGTAVDYTVINSVAALQNINNSLAGTFALGSDLNLTGVTWTPIRTFTGKLTGLGHNLSNLTSTSNGLFNELGVGGEIRDLILDNATITSVNNHVGGLVGQAYGLSSIKNITVLNSSISGATCTGGLVGLNQGNISTSYSTGNVQGNIAVGGLVGEGDAGSIQNSYSASNVRGTNLIGGLVGINSAIITNTYAVGTVTSSDTAGGLVGKITAGTVTTNWASGYVVGNSSAGGLFGSVEGSPAISNNYWDSTTTGQQYAVGGGTDTTGAITNANAYTQANYTGFDFTNTWFSVNGYTRPFLKMEATNTISNAHELQLMSMNLSNSYKLANDINLAPSLTNKSEMWKDNSASVDYGNYKGSFVPVGSSASAFTGTFDGLSHTISNLYIYRPGNQNVGFFGNVSDATIKNFSLINANITGQGYVGAAIGNGVSTNVENIITSGTVSGSQSYVGGIVGMLAGRNSSDNFSAQRIASSVNVTGDSGVGGLIGNAGYGTIAESYSTGTITSTNTNVTKLGGLFGMGGGITINNSYSTSSIVGNIGNDTFYSGMGGLARLSHKKLA